MAVRGLLLRSSTDAACTIIDDQCVVRYHEASVAARLPSAVPTNCRLGRSGTAAAAGADDDDDPLPTRNHRQRRGVRSVFHRGRPVFVRPAEANVGGSVDHHRVQSKTIFDVGRCCAQPRPAAALARPQRQRRLSVPLLRVGPSAKAFASGGGRDAAVAFTAAAAATATTTGAKPTTAAAEMRLRQAPAVQIARKSAPGRRAGRYRVVGRPPGHLREKLPLRQSQAQDEGTGQGEQTRVEAQVHGESVIGSRRERYGHQKL